MIKLKSGLELDIDIEAFKSVECFELFGKMENGRIWVITDILEMILGTSQKDNLLKHVRGERKFTPMEELEEIVTEIFSSLGEREKKS